MTKTIFASLTILTFSALMFCCSNAPKQEKVLRHVVMFGSNPEFPPHRLRNLEEVFCPFPPRYTLPKGHYGGRVSLPKGCHRDFTHVSS